MDLSGLGAAILAATPAPPVPAAPTSDWLGFVLGAGGIAFLGALGKAYLMIRDGARAREREAIAGLEKWREDADTRAARALAESDYLRRVVAYHQSRVGMRDYVIRAAGLEPPEDPPEPVRLPEVPSDPKD